MCVSRPDSAVGVEVSLRWKCAHQSQSARPDTNMARVPRSHIPLLLAVLLSLLLGAACNEDPCTVASTLHSANLRTKSSSPDNSVCDIRVTNSTWVRVSTGSGSDLVTSCPTPFAGCGTSFPVWLNGAIPSVSEGEVTRTACVTSLYSCCEQVLTVGVKNCGDFRVWRLSPTLVCPQGYCFEDPPPMMLTTSSLAPSPTSTTPPFPGPFPPEDDPHHDDDHYDDDHHDDGHHDNSVPSNNAGFDGGDDSDDNTDPNSQVRDKAALEGWEPERRMRILEAVLGVAAILLVLSLISNGVLLYKLCARQRNLTYSKAQTVYEVESKTVPPYSEIEPPMPPCTPPPPYQAKTPPKMNTWVEKNELPRY